MSMVDIATHFLGTFTVCKFAFVISIFFVNLVFFIMKSSTFPWKQSGNTELITFHTSIPQVLLLKNEINFNFANRTTNWVLENIRK